jgi:hypothetical protein
MDQLGQEQRVDQGWKDITINIFVFALRLYKEVQLVILDGLGAKCKIKFIEI